MTSTDDRILALLEAIRDRLGAQSQSSVEIHDSTRGFDVAVKCYGAGSLEDIGEEAMDEYIRVKLSLKERVEAAFSQEVATRLSSR